MDTKRPLTRLMSAQIPVVRLERIAVEDIRGIGHGEVSTFNPQKPDGPRVLGLYGQNGSGKSTLIDVLESVRRCLRGLPIEDRASGLVRAGKESGRIECEFGIYTGEDTANPVEADMRVIYSFSLSTEVCRTRKRGARPHEGTSRIFDERLSIASRDIGELDGMTLVVDTLGPGIFGPRPFFERLVGTGVLDRVYGRSVGRRQAQTIDLAQVKREALDETRSFVFSEEFRDALSSHRHHMLEQRRAEGLDEDAVSTLVFMALSALRTFADRFVYIVGSSDAGEAIAGTLKLFVPEHDLMDSRMNQRDSIDRTKFQDKVLYDKLMAIVERKYVRLDRPTRMYDIRNYENTCSMVRTMNAVISQLMPGLTLSVDIVDGDGREGTLIEISSSRDGCKIPLAYESGGVRRIVSFVNYLVLMYNDPHVLVAIDEIDSGIFENLLGGLLDVVAEHGKGQLVFTLHHLRPLEDIDRGYVCLATADPNRRYVKAAGTDSPESLRDLIDHNALPCGDDNGSLYDEADEGMIQNALTDAGYLIRDV